MTTITGIKAFFDLGKLHKCADLIYFEGPLLTHYTTDTGDHYIMYWVDADETCNRWLMARIDLESLHKYLNKKCTLYTLLQSSLDSILWVLDIDSNINCVACWITTQNTLPSAYMPEEDAMYEFETKSDYLDTMNDTYELAVPTKERSIFNIFIHKMGWTANFRKIAML